MDAVMELARAASNHQYLPSGVDQQGEPSSTTKRTRQEPNATSGTKNTRRRKNTTTTAQQEEAAQVQASEQQQEEQQQQMSAEEAATAAAAAAAVWAHRQHDDSYHDQQQQQQQHIDPDLSPTSHENIQQDLHLDEVEAATAAAAVAAAGGGSAAQEDSEGGASPTGNNRALRTTKRAAQNRAAQRAFRERRDRHMKDLETRASQFDALQALYGDMQARYSEALAIIEALKRENEQLRGIGEQEHEQDSVNNYAALTDEQRGLDDQQQQQQQHTDEDQGRGLDAVASAAVEAARMAATERDEQSDQQAAQ